MEPIKLADILSLWETDSVLNPLQITEEHIRIPKLHLKYFRMLLEERQLLRALEMSQTSLYKEKWEFYTQGPSKEDQKVKPQRWSGQSSFPSKGVSSARREVEMYVDADEDVQKMKIKIDDQKEKIELLEAIISMITNRSYHLKNILEWEKFKAGE